MIYLDNAATTRILDEVLEAMLPYLKENYGNPGAVYSIGSRARKAVAESRRTIAATIGAAAEEIFFTSGGSESDNWAIRSVAESLKEKGRHVITTKVEHHAVLNPCKCLEKQGFQVTYLDVDKYGMVDVEQLQRAIRSDTILISVMAANNEVGTLQPIGEIGRIAKEKGILFHTDAVQAYGHIPLAVEELQVDLLSVSAHKFHGPKGVGFLYVRKGVKLPPQIQGGGQEHGMRAGTENVAGIVGMAKAAQLAHLHTEENAAVMQGLTRHMVNRLTGEIPECILNGHPEKRLPGNVSVCVVPVEGESVLVQLDMKGICASSGSACTMGSNEPSHVLLAMGRSPEQAKGSLRFTLSEETTLEEIDRTVDEVKNIVGNLRRMMGWKA